MNEECRRGAGLAVAKEEIRYLFGLSIHIFLETI
jgi:hypothetical protein